MEFYSDACVGKTLSKREKKPALRYPLKLSHPTLPVVVDAREIGH